ncbi:MAG: polysaccharide pyruvyl transferase family protein [Clostridiales bacterium]|nr:polysaccharide pyruvyl transferase family protein [Clostridiales bacterium]
MDAQMTESRNTQKYKILLLTNRDSDNLGDQVIEECDIALIRTAMKNLGITDGEYEITSRAAGIISQKYLATKDPANLKSAEEVIKNADTVIFGGAPLFNYQYQDFYERTAITLELCQKHNKAAVFSAIGIEHYDENDPKCRRLKKALNLECVKQITTRDNFEFLQNYKERESLAISKVADPAVFSFKVFEKFCRPAVPNETGAKRVGIFILRSGGFKDNKIDFSRKQSARMWAKLTGELKSRGYECELLTSGHTADEAFLDYLVRKCNISIKRCVFNMNTPEQLIEKISSYDAVVSTRLHPSIISFSLGIPSLGIIWNPKVSNFYKNIGYGARTVDVRSFDAGAVVDQIGAIIEEGVVKDEEYLYTIYGSLFSALKNIIAPHAEIPAYSYSSLIENIPRFEGTDSVERDLKLRRKFRRIYQNYNDVLDKNLPPKKIPLKYSTESKKGAEVTCLFNNAGNMKVLKDGTHIYSAPDMVFLNDSKLKPLKNVFLINGYNFKGWNLKVRQNSIWYWYMANGSLALRGTGRKKDFEKAKMVFKDNMSVPKLPGNIQEVVFEAAWKPTLAKRIKGKLKRILKRA